MLLELIFTNEHTFLVFLIWFMFISQTAHPSRIIMNQTASPSSFLAVNLLLGQLNIVYRRGKMRSSSLLFSAGLSCEKCVAGWFYPGVQYGVLLSLGGISWDYHCMGSESLAETWSRVYGIPFSVKFNVAFNFGFWCRKGFYLSSRSWILWI